MKSNQLVNLINIAGDDRRYAILKALQRIGPMSYSSLKKYVGFSEGKNPIFAYHCKVMRQAGLIIAMAESTNVRLTDRGTAIIKLLDNSLQEKFITNEPMCTNSPNATHDFITVCRNCSIIKE